MLNLFNKYGLKNIPLKNLARYNIEKIELASKTVKFLTDVKYKIQNGKNTPLTANCKK
jgi:hypothetical protein